MDLQVFRGRQFSSTSSDYIVQDISGKGTFSKVAICIKVYHFLEKRKRVYAQISQINSQSSDSTSPERKRKIGRNDLMVKFRRAATESQSSPQNERRGRSVVKKPYGKISQGSHRIADISSPERRRSTMDSEEKNTELPITSEEASCTVAEVISQIKREVASRITSRQYVHQK